MARKIGVNPSTISRLARGEVQPNWKTAQAIAKATKGDVMANDFFEDDARDEKAGDQ